MCCFLVVLGFVLHVLGQNYLVMDLHKSSDCSHDSHLVTWSFPLPSECTSIPFEEHLTFQYSSPSSLVVRNYTNSNCSGSFHDSVFQSSQCQTVEVGGIEHYVNFSIFENDPYDQEGVDGWIVFSNYDDALCQSTINDFVLIDEFGDYEFKFGTKALRTTPSQVSCTDDYMSIHYESGGGKKIFPREYEGQCIEFYNETFPSDYYAKSIKMNCITKSEADEQFFSTFPKKSFRKYSFLYSSYEPTCRNSLGDSFFVLSVIKLDQCWTRGSGSVYFISTENAFIEFEYSHPNCSEESFKEFRIVEGNLFGNCKYFHEDKVEPGITVYRKFQLEDDPFFPTLLASIVVGDYGCEDSLVPVMKNIEDVTWIIYLGEEVCQPSLGYTGGLVKGSFRGNCVDGIPTLKYFEESDHCYGPHDVVTYEFAHGPCKQYDDGQFVYDGVFSHISCIPRFCGEYNELEIGKVCNGRGRCTALDLCECDEGYTGNLCEFWSCFDIDKDNEEVCHGKGNCISPDICECNTYGYTGMQCENSDVFVATVLGPTLFVGGLAFFSLVATVICGFLGCMIVLLVVVFLFCVGMVTLGIMTSIQKNKMKKFSKLRNVDILLQEQDLEDDETIAHLNIDRNSFKINSSEITITKIIGEGGSNSVVYLVDWKGLTTKKCAFKCFRTRSICTSQDTFDEFEREVQVLASVNHPNVVHFFGACLDPPRVGILMEFCENGDLKQFLGTQRILRSGGVPKQGGPNSSQDQGKGYPFMEKMRLISEITNVMAYIHSRNIIHRDLKLENILISEHEQCKLMDFGLSKIIDHMSQHKTNRIGTSIYMAPEIYLGGMYDESCDVYSFAILLFAVCTENYLPYGDKKFTNVETMVAMNPRFRPDLKEIDYINSIPNNMKKFLKELCSKCWEHESSRRPPFEKLNELIEKRRRVMKEEGETAEDDYDVFDGWDVWADGKKEEESIGSLKREIKELKFWKQNATRIIENLEKIDRQ